MAAKPLVTHEDVVARVQRAFAGLTAKVMKKNKPLTPAAIADLSEGALHHPDPEARRWCLFLLDHYANDTSTHVFAQALHDELPQVRASALHGITCVPCKDGELCLADVIPPVIGVLQDDPAADLRIKAIPTLLGLAGSDPRIREALRTTAKSDPDPLVRKCARDALDGHFEMPKKRYERSQRRHTVGKH